MFGGWCVRKKLGHLFGSDTSPCKQIFENLRVQRREPRAIRKKRQQMSAQIVRTGMKLLWQNSAVHRSHPVEAANASLRRMHVSPAGVRGQRFPAASSCGGFNPIFKACAVDIMEIHTGSGVGSMYWSPALPFCNAHCCLSPV